MSSRRTSPGCTGSMEACPSIISEVAHLSSNGLQDLPDSRTRLPGFPRRLPPRHDTASWFMQSKLDPSGSQRIPALECASRRQGQDVPRPGPVLLAESGGPCRLPGPSFWSGDCPMTDPRADRSLRLRSAPPSSAGREGRPVVPDPPGDQGAPAGSGHPDRPGPGTTGRHLEVRSRRVPPIPGESR